MSGTHSRNKGAAWEREIVRILRERGWSAKRNLAQVRYGEQEGSDVEAEYGTFGAHVRFAIEAKCGKSIRFWAAYQQAAEASQHYMDADGDDRIPMVIAKRDYHQPMVMMDLWDFLGIIQELSR